MARLLLAAVCISLLVLATFADIEHEEHGHGHDHDHDHHHHHHDHDGRKLQFDTISLMQTDTFR